MKIQYNITWLEIQLLASSTNRMVYAMNSCWWKVGNPCYALAEKGLPCGPRSEVLLETEDPSSFLKAAQNGIAHYGKWGLCALFTAYHGNVLTDGGLPTSLNEWYQYNDLMDATFDIKNMLRMAEMPEEFIPSI